MFLNTVEPLHNGHLGGKKKVAIVTSPPPPNPFKSPKSDNIRALSREKGARISNMITKWKMIWSFIKIILSTTCNSLRKCMEISLLENFYVDIENLRGRGEVRYFVNWAWALGQILVNKWLANTLSTCQSNISQHVSQLSVDKLCQSISVRWVLVDMLADILADSWPRVGRYVSWKVSKLHKIWEVVIVNRFEQESVLTIC